VTHPRHGRIVAELLRGEMSQDLGPASLETLALVAYFGPVTRSVIDHVRGVSSAVSLRTLLVRGMIERSREGRGEHTYRVTPELLREMGITSREDLPDFEDLSQLLARSLAAREASTSESQPSAETA
jgi:segregation and condensation protein B